MLSYLTFKGVKRENGRIFALFSDGRATYRFEKELLEQRIQTMRQLGIDSRQEEEAVQYLDGKIAVL